MFDRIPNPRYNPAYVQGGINAYIPTLRMDINDEKMSLFEASGLTIETAAEQLAGFFRTANVTDGIRFTAESIVVIETGQVLKNFQSGIAAIFELDDVTHLKLNTGDVVEVKFYRV
jgi:hypothetical protein